MIFREFLHEDEIWKKWNFTKILENLRRTKIENFEKLKSWKCEKRERERKRGFEKIFWGSWEKRVNFKWFDPLSKRIFRDSRNKNIFLSTRRKSKKSSKEKFREIFFQWRIDYSDWWLIFEMKILPFSTLMSFFKIVTHILWLNQYCFRELIFGNS